MKALLQLAAIDCVKMWLFVLLYLTFMSVTADYSLFCIPYTVHTMYNLFCTACTVYTITCTVYHVQYILSICNTTCNILYTHVLYIMYSINYKLYCTPCTVHYKSVLYTRCSIHYTHVLYTMYSIHYTPVLYTMYGINCNMYCPLNTIHQSWKLERKKLSIANQTQAMILDLLSIMSKDGFSLFTRFNVTQIYPVILTLHVRWFSLNETGFP